MTQTLTRATERKLLQIAVAIAGAVPVSAGAAGGVWGPAMLNPGSGADLDSHYRYLSGLLLAIGLIYWSTLPRIEKARGQFGVLTLIVVTGGFFRALGMMVTGPTGVWMLLALVMELGVTPALYLWQARVSRLYAQPQPAGPQGELPAGAENA